MCVLTTARSVLLIAITAEVAELQYIIVILDVT
jgi:hypothetical protein